MSNTDAEQRVLEDAIHAGEKGWAFEILGSSILLMAGITVMWIWVGWRSGTWFWFWWTGGLGAIGITFAGIGHRTRTLAEDEFARLSADLRARLAREKEPPAPEERAA